MRLATSRATYFETDAPIITEQQLAAEIGMSTSTAGDAARLVCSLPGSPVERVTAYRRDGTRGQITTYRLATLDPPTLLEQLAVAAENLDAPKSSRPQLTCPTDPTHPIRTTRRHECAVCNTLLDETVTVARGAMNANCVHSPEADATVERELSNASCVHSRQCPEPRRDRGESGGARCRARSGRGDAPASSGRARDTA